MAKPHFKNGIRKEPNGTWTARYAQHYSRGWKTRQQAVEARGTLAQGTKPADMEVTVREFSQRWTTDPEYERPASTTNRHYRERIQAFVRLYGDKRLSEITVQDCERLAQKHGTHAFRVASTMLSDALRHRVDGLTDNPFRHAKLTRPDEYEGTRVPTTGEVERLIATSSKVHKRYGHYFAAVIELAAYTGLRQGELLALKWDDIDWQQGILHVQRNHRSKTGQTVEFTKNKQRREVALHPRATEALRVLKREAPAQSPYVVLSKGGKRYNAGALNYWWHPVRDKADLTDIDFRSLRHHYGTLLALKGATAPAIAQQLGHQDGGVLALRTYIKPTSQDANDEIRRLLTQPAQAAESKTGNDERPEHGPHNAASGNGTQPESAVTEYPGSIPR